MPTQSRYEARQVQLDNRRGLEWGVWDSASQTFVLGENWGSKIAAEQRAGTINQAYERAMAANG